MLDARMVAASIQVLALAPHGTPTPADRITASSQGVLMDAMDDIRCALGSEDSRRRECISVALSQTRGRRVSDFDPIPAIRLGKVKSSVCRGNYLIGVAGLGGGLGESDAYGH